MRVEGEPTRSADDALGELIVLCQQLDVREQQGDEIDEPAGLDMGELARQLDPHLRQLLSWHIDEQLTYRDIAVRLGVQPPEALRELARAYARLSALLHTAESVASLDSSAGD